MKILVVRADQDYPIEFSTNKKFLVKQLIPLLREFLNEKKNPSIVTIIITRADEKV